MTRSDEEKNEVVITGGRRPLNSSNLEEARPGTPLGRPLQHINAHIPHALRNSADFEIEYFRLDFPQIMRRNIIGFLGNYGSGKTEAAVNFAIQMGLKQSDAESGYTGPVKLIDLDIVNMYFRSREATSPLESAGVEVISPRGEHFWADLPIILPEVRGQVLRKDGTLVLDVGGDDLGARVISHIKADIERADYSLLMVVNANRPFTSDIAGASKILKELEIASGLKINGLVSNTHLMDETSPDEIRRGYRFAKEMERATGIPVVMVSAGRELICESGLSQSEFDVPLLPIYRFMLPPWRKGE